MKQILISGYLGFENFGDEALVYVLVRDLLKVGFKINDITIISKNPLVTSNIYGVKSINRFNLFDLFFALINSKTLIFIGGLFQDKTSFKSFLYYFLQLFFAHMLEKEIVFFGAGIGPFQRKITQALFNFGIKSVRFIAVRDEVSANIASYGGNTVVSCDPVWSIEVDYSFQNQIPNINWQQPVLGVSMRNDKNLKGHHLINIADKLVRVLGGMKEWQILLLPCMPKEDLPILYELQDLIQRKISTPGRVILLEDFSQFSISQQAGILASCDVMVGMRYHALLVPLANGKPVFGLIYDQKVKSLMDFANQVGVYFRDDLDQAWSYFWQNIQNSSNNAKQAQQRALELHKKNVWILERLFEL